MFKRTGDGLLADSVGHGGGALRPQGAGSTERRAEAAPELSRLRLRAGIALGDVIADGDDLFGDGVNLAARLEGVAGAGEVVVSEAAARVGEARSWNSSTSGSSTSRTCPIPSAPFARG